MVCSTGPFSFWEDLFTALNQLVDVSGYFKCVSFRVGEDLCAMMNYFRKMVGFALPLYSPEGTALLESIKNCPCCQQGFPMLKV